MEKHNIYQWDEIYPTVEDFEDDIKKGNLYVAEENEKIIALYVISDEADEAYNYAEWKYPNETSLVLHRFCVSPGFKVTDTGSIVNAVCPNVHLISGASKIVFPALLIHSRASPPNKIVLSCRD